MYAQDLWQILQQALLQSLMDARGEKRSCTFVRLISSVSKLWYNSRALIKVCATMQSFGIKGQMEGRYNSTLEVESSSVYLPLMCHNGFL